jgi:hypothetical protein
MARQRAASGSTSLAFQRAKMDSPRTVIRRR